MSGRRILYLPIEVKARELLGKMFLAARAVERDWIVIIGARGKIREYMGVHPPGAYIENGIFRHLESRFKEIRSAGHRIANLCEENLVYPESRDYCDRRLDSGGLRWVEQIHVVGPVNAEDVRSHRPDFADRVAVTGNPRFDILLPELRGLYETSAQEIRKRYGRFVLVNTNFSQPNPFQPGQDPIAELVRRGVIRGEEHIAQRRRFAEYKGRQMQGFQALLTELSKAGTIERIVIRPHPNENHDMWRKWAAPMNIEVCYEGSTNEWLLAAEAMLHPGCTTGIEGLLLDRPVFSYVPHADSEYLNLADAVSVGVASAAEFLDGFAKVRDLGRTQLRDNYAGQRRRLGKAIANIEPPSAADRTLDQLERLDLPAVTLEQAGLAMPSLAQRAWRRILDGAHQATPVSNSRANQKFPDLSAEEIRSPLKYWMRTGVLTRMPQSSKLGDRLWGLH